MLDDSDTESVRAASLTALTHFGNPTELAEDTDFARQVERMEVRVPMLESAGFGGAGDAAPEEGALKKAVSVFQSRHGRK